MLHYTTSRRDVVGMSEGERGQEFTSRLDCVKTRMPRRFLIISLHETQLTRHVNRQADQTCYLDTRRPPFHVTLFSCINDVESSNESSRTGFKQVALASNASPISAASHLGIHESPRLISILSPTVARRQMLTS